MVVWWGEGEGGLALGSFSSSFLSFIASIRFFISLTSCYEPASSTFKYPRVVLNPAINRPRVHIRNSSCTGYNGTRDGIILRTA